AAVYDEIYFLAPQVCVRDDAVVFEVYGNDVVGGGVLQQRALVGSGFLLANSVQIQEASLIVNDELALPEKLQTHQPQNLDALAILNVAQVDQIGPGSE